MKERLEENQETGCASSSTVSAHYPNDTIDPRCPREKLAGNSAPLDVVGVGGRREKEPRSEGRNVTFQTTPEAPKKSTMTFRNTEVVVPQHDVSRDRSFANGPVFGT